MSIVSTHSRPKAAALAATDSLVLQSFQHTAARRRLVSVTACISPCAMFQHTAARRRLNRQRVDTQSDACFNTQPPEGGWQWRRCSHYRGRVSTHSRPKAAVRLHGRTTFPCPVSTHSRPKAAAIQPYGDGTTSRFQHTAARRRLLLNLLSRVQPS